MPAKVLSATLVGLQGVPVDVEADVAAGLPMFNLVGLPDAAVKEARDRVRSAIRNCGIAFPRTRVTVNLAPADLKKEGPAFDLPIACAVLLAAGKIEFEREDGATGETADVISVDDRTLLVGELGLDGSVRPITGILSIALAARRLGFPAIILPAANADEASAIGGITILPARHLLDVVKHILGQEKLVAHERRVRARQSSDDVLHPNDLAYVHGLHIAKRALAVAAAGGHNLLFVGPPGSGKSLLARALPTILPTMAEEEQLDVTMVHSVVGLVPHDGGLITERPFRSPHHSASDTAIIGGGTIPRPGEVSLAHRGVLFLDEFPEFSRAVLESMRQPLEDGVVTVSRAAGSVTFPARFQLIAAMNPCPCGYWRDEHHQCVCPPGQIMKYQRKISGPLLDRIDLVVDVPRQPTEIILTEPHEERSSVVRAQVEAARERQRARSNFTSQNLDGRARSAGNGCPPVNSEMSAAQLRIHATLADDARNVLLHAAEKFHLSSRATIRTIRVARTIADLVGADAITSGHLTEALSYRPKFQMGA